MARRKRSHLKAAEKQKWVRALGVIGLLSLMASIISIAVLEKTRLGLNKDHLSHVSRIAFGSGTSVDYRSQPIWVQGVIPSNPNAWIWLGDMAYMDKPRINCDDLPWHPQCNCSSSWLHQPNYSCMAGNSEFASSRMEVQLSNPDYAQFLAFMCPGHRAKRLHPPTGSDPSVCQRQIFGTYDDQDYGWEHGNRRLPQKDNMKQFFLDAIGEPNESPRRQPGRGIEWKHTMDAGDVNQSIDILLLDERYYRDTLPCYTRRMFCEKVALADQQHPKHAWCLDFLQEGKLGKGSCCKKDEDIAYGWCLQSSNKAHALWDSICDPKSHKYGHYASPFGNGEVGDIINEDDEISNSTFCEILGEQQRRWFEDAILGSNAPLKLVVSSSVVLGNPIKKSCQDLGSSTNEAECPCFGDDWECYKPAQLQLLNVLTRSSGCVVLLTGGLEYSDIRVLKPGVRHTLLHYGDLNLSYPLYQAMASGLTASSTRNFSCDVLRQDPLHLRDHAECDFVKAPAFGMVEVVWASGSVKLQIRDGLTGAVKLESKFKLSSCLQRDQTRKLKGS
ncbi:hypothetical protein GOP47_0005178 [Adiantum capillus-veneris]|uniref:Uncharacterized protein n=1 Tax=Adiantum capillus-veneris TaxID=13818 RepID=A0A9D4V522_ADICA|nr:hypothetical protein GOP47_0005178 [Adiantum capillus-veneris]